MPAAMAVNSPTKRITASGNSCAGCATSTAMAGMCARVLALEQNYDDTIDRLTDNDSLTTRERSMRVLGMRNCSFDFLA